MMKDSVVAPSNMNLLYSSIALIPLVERRKTKVVIRKIIGIAEAMGEGSPVDLYLFANTFSFMSLIIDCKDSKKNSDLNMEKIYVDIC